MTIEIKTNNQTRATVNYRDLPEKHQKEWIDLGLTEEMRDSADFVLYKDRAYPVTEIVRINAGELKDLGWHGVASDTYWSGVCFKFIEDDTDYVICGSYSQVEDVSPRYNPRLTALSRCNWSFVETRLMAEIVGHGFDAGEYLIVNMGTLEKPAHYRFNREGLNLHTYWLCENPTDLEKAQALRYSNNQLVTSKELTVQFRNHTLTIPIGTPTSHNTACGIDRDYNFITCFNWVPMIDVGPATISKEPQYIPDTFLLGDLDTYGLHIPYIDLK